MDNNTTRKIPFQSVRKGGFTLIELLMVIAVVLILSAITFGISRGVQNAQSRAKVKVELATISQALEQFKSRYGDYPWVKDDPELLAQALLGWANFEGSSTNLSFQLKGAGEVPESGPKPFIDITKMSFDGMMPTNPASQPNDIELTDPWGNAYLYYYKTEATGSWDNFGYVLYSAGPDGKHVPVGSDGVLTKTIRNSVDNADNAYAGQ